MLILPSTRDRPLCLACSRDSQNLYLGGRDGRIQVWDRRSQDLPEVFRHPGRMPIVNLICGPHETILAACSREIWLLHTNTRQSEMHTTVGLGSALVAFGRDDNFFYTAHAAGHLYAVSSPLTAQRVQSTECPNDPLALASHPTSCWVVLGYGTNRQGGACWWQAEQTSLVQGGSINTGSPVSSVAISPLGNCLALGTRNGTVFLVDPESNNPTRGRFDITRKRQGEWLEQGVLGLAFSPDGRELFTVSSDGDAQRWDVEGQRLLNSLDWNMGRLHALAFSPDGQTAASIADFGNVVVWDVD